MTLEELTVVRDRLLTRIRKVPDKKDTIDYKTGYNDAILDFYAETLHKETHDTSRV